MNRKSSSSSAQPSSARLHHRGFEMADRAGRDLPHRRAAPRQPGGVVLGGQIADQRGDAVPRVQQGQRPLEQRRLAGARARHQADHEDAGVAEPLPQRAGHEVVLLEDVLPDFDESWLVAHGSISRATSSSSRPSIHLRRGRAALRRSRTTARCSSRTLGLAAVGQKTTTGTSSITSRDPASGVCRARHLVRRRAAPPSPRRPARRA